MGKKSKKQVSVDAGSLAIIGDNEFSVESECWDSLNSDLDEVQSLERFGELGPNGKMRLGDLWQGAYCDLHQNLYGTAGTLWNAYCFSKIRKCTKLGINWTALAASEAEKAHKSQDEGVSSHCPDGLKESDKVLVVSLRDEAARIVGERIRRVAKHHGYVELASATLQTAKIDDDYYTGHSGLTTCLILWGDVPAFLLAFDGSPGPLD